MSDSIHLRNLVFHGRHGALDEEATLGQRFEVDLLLHLDLMPAGRSDAVDDTVDYGAAYEAVRSIVEGRRFRLLEAVAEAISDAILRRFPRVDSLEVTVRKPNAPVPGVFDYVAVTLHRRR